MYVDIVTPDEEVFSGEVIGVKVPGLAGSFEMLNNHAPIVSALAEGEVRIQTSTDTLHYRISGGMLEMNNNKATILAESLLK